MLTVEFLLLTIVGNRRKPALPMRCQPGAACLQISARKYVGIVRPVVQRLGWPAVKFVAIGSEDELVVRVRFPRKYYETHQSALRLAIFEPVVNEAPGNRESIG